MEVVVATMVMALTITSSLQVLQRGLTAIDTARNTTLAGQILQSQMEKLRLLTWSQLTGASGPMTLATFTPDITAVGSSTQVSKFTTAGGGSCTQSLSYDTAYDVAGQHTMVNITLTATWSGIDNIQRSRIYSTRYAKNGISDFFYTAH